MSPGPPPSTQQYRRRLTWAVTFVAVVSTVVGPIAHPAGCVAEGRPLARLEEHAFHAQAEIAAAVGGTWGWGWWR